MATNLKIFMRTNWLNFMQNSQIVCRIWLWSTDSWGCGLKIRGVRGCKIYITATIPLSDCVEAFFMRIPCKTVNQRTRKLNLFRILLCIQCIVVNNKSTTIRTIDLLCSMKLETSIDSVNPEKFGCRREQNSKLLSYKHFQIFNTVWRLITTVSVFCVSK